MPDNAVPSPRATVPNEEVSPVDPVAFAALYGYSPEQYVERVAVSTALAPTLASQKTALAAAKKKLVPGGWENQPTQAKMQEGADAENLYLACTQIVDTLEANQAAAKAYAAQTMDFGTFRSYLGRMCNIIIDSGFVVEDALLAAVQAALEALRTVGPNDQSALYMRARLGGAGSGAVDARPAATPTTGANPVATHTDPAYAYEDRETIAGRPTDRPIDPNVGPNVNPDNSNLNRAGNVTPGNANPGNLGRGNLDPNVGPNRNDPNVGRPGNVNQNLNNPNVGPNVGPNPSNPNVGPNRPNVGPNNPNLNPNNPNNPNLNPNLNPNVNPSTNIPNSNPNRPVNPNPSTPNINRPIDPNRPNLNPNLNPNNPNLRPVDQAVDPNAIDHRPIDRIDTHPLAKSVAGEPAATQTDADREVDLKAARDREAAKTDTTTQTAAEREAAAQAARDRANRP